MRERKGEVCHLPKALPALPEAHIPTPQLPAQTLIRLFLKAVQSGALDGKSICLVWSGSLRERKGTRRAAKTQRVPGGHDVPLGEVGFWFLSRKVEVGKTPRLTSSRLPFLGRQ